MKKIVLGCLLFLGMISGLYADKTEDTQFNQYVESTKKSSLNTQGMSVTADSTYRIIYACMPISASSSHFTQETYKVMKKSMIEEMSKETAEVKVIKDLKIQFVFSFVTTDKKLISIPLSCQDL